MLDGGIFSDYVRRRTSIRRADGRSISAMLYGQSLLLLGRTYCQATGKSLHWLGAKCGNPRMFKRLAAGHGVNSGKGDQAIIRLAEIWPDGVEWPAEVHRPSVPVGDDA